MTAATNLQATQIMKRVHMTAEGRQALDSELKRLKTVERPSIIRAIAEARAHGDLSENAEYHAAKERQSFVEGRIAEIEDRIARAEVIDPSRLGGEKVRFGASVTVIEQGTGKQSSYRIVGEDEASVAEGKISVSSPIARALIGREAGDAVEVSTPGGTRNYEIVAISWQ